MANRQAKMNCAKDFPTSYIDFFKLLGTSRSLYAACASQGRIIFLPASIYKRDESLSVKRKNE
jgi:hypothetical protein